MSDLEDSFLQQIARQPHDWLPRLIFADWLEEQGDPRAELIRLSHALTQLDCADRQPKEARLLELSAAGVVWPSPGLPNSLDVEFILIPPGEFRMGSPATEVDRCRDENQVNVALTQGFWLGQYAVTQAEYQALTGENPSHFHRKELKADSSRHPVEYVNWKQVMNFCRRLTAQERKAGRLPADWEYTLPTEAQWEYACRAGTTTATFFGDKLDHTQANFAAYWADKGESKRKTMPVGSYQPNAWNLYDMHGNVFEWCRDRYVDQLPGGTDPEVVEANCWWQVLRGGSWTHYSWFCRSAQRRSYVPHVQDKYLGFRLAAVQLRTR